MGQDADALILAGKRLAEELRALAERAQKIAAQQIELIEAIKRTQKDNSARIAGYVAYVGRCCWL
jgi:hypothetical protein